ncbi:Uncharacterized protein FWK35_00004511 [Aphis craccivora]|uniref:Uncharacterized protein n=1 Tax=Aphis craccivora TaxID=307492 RepID=A0A6G0Z4V5_APHCR|nr:Uncharacterized protein FWK35_00004511 [Aphis craccivora]
MTVTGAERGSSGRLRRRRRWLRRRARAAAGPSVCAGTTAPGNIELSLGGVRRNRAGVIVVATAATAATAATVVVVVAVAVATVAGASDPSTIIIIIIIFRTPRDGRPESVPGDRARHTYRTSSTSFSTRYSSLASVVIDRVGSSRGR